MCVAAPGRIIDIDGNIARVEFSGNIVKVHIGLLDVKPGDWVLTHAGLAIEVMHPERAKELADLLQEITEAANGGR
jgi:hydrogenase expression/formation protein HypC